MSDETFFRVYEGERGGICRGCQAEIVWHETLSGKHMPINLGARPVQSEMDLMKRRRILFFRASDSHWSTCPAREQFHKRRKPVLRR
jgi:hypothetical protein